jgi:hypothetical protein
MVGEQTGAQESLFYGLSLEGHVPQGHMLRSTDRFVDLLEERSRPRRAAPTVRGDGRNVHGSAQHVMQIGISLWAAD